MKTGPKERIWGSKFSRQSWTALTGLATRTLTARPWVALCNRFCNTGKLPLRLRRATSGAGWRLVKTTQGLEFMRAIHAGIVKERHKN